MIMHNLPEAKKKTPSQSARYGQVPPLPPASDPGQLDNTQLKFGQKQELEIKLTQAEQLIADIKVELNRLESGLKSASVANDTSGVDQLNQSHDQLMKLDKKVQSRIMALKKQLRTVPPDVKMWLSKIQSDCGAYLKEVKKAKAWLYRGTSGSDAFVGKSWLSREPKDSNKQAQLLFDQMLAQLGFVALRSNSIFTTSDFWHTKEFSQKTYVIFPVDNQSNYTYTTSSDLILDSPADVAMNPEALQNLKDELHRHLITIQNQMGKKVPLSLRELLYFTSMMWSTWSSIQLRLARFIKATKGVYPIPDKFTKVDHVAHHTTPATFVKKWNPQQTNLAKALKNRYEVYVSGTYYALDAELYGEYITTMFRVPVQSMRANLEWPT